MNNKKINVVHLGISGFPYGLAPIQKCLLMYKGLVEAGVNVTVINRRAVHNKDNVELDKEGIYEGVHYVYTPGTPYRPKNLIKRNLLKIYGRINEVRLLIKLHRGKKLDAGIIYTQFFSDVLYYSIISRLFKFPVILNYVEYRSGISSRKSLRHKINDYLFDKVAFSLVDGILPISDYLIDIVRKHAPDKPYLKLPIICDFGKFMNVERTYEGEYFLFCGSAYYLEIVTFILKAFDSLKDNSNISLYLLVNGKKEQMRKLNSEINKTNKKNFVKTFSNVPYEKLVDLYVNATGLLIPLRPTLQDAARFPFKIGEYTAAGNPIITTDYGEIKNYFVDDDTALIAKKYDIEAFSDKMSFVISNPEKAKKIGINGQRMGLQNFNYESFGKKIKSFILSLLNECA